jgi:hypothetical protein
MYIQINTDVPLNNMGTPISSCVAKMIKQNTYPVGESVTGQNAEVYYFESYAFGDSVGWDIKKSLDITSEGEAGPYVKPVYQFTWTSEQLDSGITTQMMYDNIKAEMVADGFTDSDLVVTA